MVLWIDADGCPVVTLTAQLAEKLSIELHVVKNISHHLELNYGIIHTVDHGADQVDFFIANHLRPNDLVITQDYGLAAMAIAKGAFALTQYGQLIDSQNIDYLLEKRHFHKEMRKNSGKYTKFKKRTAEDDRRYLDALKTIVEKLMVISPTL